MIPGLFLAAAVPAGGRGDPPRRAKRSRKDDESIIRPAFDGLSVRDFALERGIAKVDEFALAQAHLSKKTVANHVTLLISMLNLAVELS